MPYILVRGNLASYGHKYPWRVLVSGLKAIDIEQLSRFSSGGYCDDSTIVYLQHPCVILTALEVLGYKVVASSSTSVKQDYNEYMWTMRKDFSEPEPDTVSKAVNNMVKKRGIVWNYYTKKVDGSQVIVFCKFCDQSYIQNATRMERHMERCPKCPEDIKQQLIQAAHSKKYKANILGIKNDWPKQESSINHDIKTGLEDLNDWNYQNQPYSDETSTTQQNVNLSVENNDSDGNSVNRDWDASRENAESVTAGSQERTSSARQRKSHNPRRIMQSWPFTSIRGYLPLQNKIFQEQLLERRALRKVAELELRRKTLELERLQWQYQSDKIQSEVRWAHEMRMMQLREERERRSSRIEQNKT
ncbi:hypothetical protein HN011_012552 [Eciton burchellii]|nr:hypothetical protein HN011_012552 [Eciton burchellii]